MKCTSAQPGSLIVLVTRLFMCDKRFRYGPLHPAAGTCTLFLFSQHFVPSDRSSLSLSLCSTSPFVYISCSFRFFPPFSLFFSFPVFLFFFCSLRMERGYRCHYHRGYYFNHSCCVDCDPQTLDAVTVNVSYRQLEKLVLNIDVFLTRFGFVRIGKRVQERCRSIFVRHKLQF